MKAEPIVAAADLDDLVFENRNKNYGAYRLRKSYTGRLGVALVSALSLFLLLLMLASMKPRQKGVLLPPIAGDSQIIIIDPPIEIPKPERAYPPVVSDPTTIHRRVRVVRQDVVTPPIDTNTVFAYQGPRDGNPAQGVGSPATGAGGNGGSLANTRPEPPEEEFMEFTETNPEFPGGPKAYEKYLQKNINYPTFAVQNDIQGTIFLQVKLTARGDIADVSVLKGIGGGCDEEAVRVVKSMPRWKPGKHNGQAVPVKFILRVRMLLN